jgi:4-hydroxybenzoate polyprenyltransferase
VNQTVSTGDSNSFVGRWWTYQRERFPLIGHGLLVAVFSTSAVCFSILLRVEAGDPVGWPRAVSVATAFVCCLLMFLQLRIADEFKDFREDLEFRPYRPVQRGLVTLRQLGVLFIVCAAIQLGLALLLSPTLVVLLLIAWAYLALMSREFFVPEWLKARPLIYLWSHMFIMPLVDLFATGCDWTSSPEGRPGSLVGLGLFLGASYFNGVVIEIGRKIRSPAEEERGVRTYSSLWGPRRAVVAWLAAVSTTGSLAIAASVYIGTWRWFAGVIICLVLGAATVARVFLGNMSRGAGKRIELASGLWTIGLYLALGVIPLCIRVLSR